MYSCFSLCSKKISVAKRESNMNFFLLLWWEVGGTPRLVYVFNRDGGDTRHSFLEGEGTSLILKIIKTTFLCMFMTVDVIIDSFGQN
jgi:hypothetical protein